MPVETQKHCHEACEEVEVQSEGVQDLPLVDPLIDQVVNTEADLLKGEFNLKFDFFFLFGALNHRF